jgi:hypothetical protein
LKDNERDGLGIFKYKGDFVGRVYLGPWKNGLQEGIGYESLPNGNMYVGTFVSGKKNG